jgi:hypothetical protein
MIVHIKMEFNLDTNTAETSKVQQQVTMLEGKHLCRRPGCHNETPLDKKYCGMQCFRAHGVRTRTKAISISQIPPLDLPVLLGQQGAPNAPTDELHKCAWHECERLIGMGNNGTIQKFCGRECYGKSRRRLSSRTSLDARPVVDAVTGVITSTSLNRERSVEPAQIVDYSTFSFHQGVPPCASL